MKKHLSSREKSPTYKVKNAFFKTRRKIALKKAKKSKSMKSFSQCSDASTLARCGHTAPPSTPAKGTPVGTTPQLASLLPPALQLMPVLLPVKMIKAAVQVPQHLVSQQMTMPLGLMTLKTNEIHSPCAPKAPPTSPASGPLTTAITSTPPASPTSMRRLRISRRGLVAPPNTPSTCPSSPKLMTKLRS